MNYLIPSENGLALATVAIGSKYYDIWKTRAYPSWERYCRKYGFGLFVLTDFTPQAELSYRKKPTWEKFLLMDQIRKTNKDITRVCYLDTDFLISPLAPNIFLEHTDPTLIGLVSEIYNLPYPDQLVRRRIAFHRHYYYSKNYPLDSSLFMTLEDYGSYHNTAPLKDSTCAGFYVGSIEHHADLFKGWFYKYKGTIDSVTGGGDNFHFNYETQLYGNIQLLDYKFQALWTHEMAWKYPFLYHYGKDNANLIRECIEASLLENYFLHFAGSWHESKMWEEVPVLTMPESLERFEQFSEYCKLPVTGNSAGIVKP